MRRVALLLAFVAAAQAGLCPLDEHLLCNSNHEENVCVCAIGDDESPAPGKSCNLVAKPDEEGKFPAVSVKFSLGEDDEDDDDDDEWPQSKFIETISNSLKIQKDSLIILRANCLGTENEFTVQFAVLKKNVNESLPYEEDDFVNAEEVANRLKAMGHLNKIGDLDVDAIEFVEELIPIEFEPDNTDLIIISICSAVAFVLMLLLGCCTVCRKKDDYEDDLQKA